MAVRCGGRVLTVRLLQNVPRTTSVVCRVLYDCIASLDGIGCWNGSPGVVYSATVLYDWIAPSN